MGTDETPVVAGIGPKLHPLASAASSRAAEAQRTCLRPDTIALNVADCGCSMQMPGGSRTRCDDHLGAVVSSAERVVRFLFACDEDGVGSGGGDFGGGVRRPGAGRHHVL